MSGCSDTDISIYKCNCPCCYARNNYYKHNDNLLILKINKLEEEINKIKNIFITLNNTFNHKFPSSL